MKSFVWAVGLSLFLMTGEARAYECGYSYCSGIKLFGTVKNRFGTPIQGALIGGSRTSSSGNYTAYPSFSIYGCSYSYIWGSEDFYVCSNLSTERLEVCATHSNYYKSCQFKPADGRWSMKMDFVMEEDNIGSLPLSECKINSGKFSTVNGACKDSSTGRTWARANTFKRNYTQAISDCKNLKVNGVGGWRLPSLAEVKALTFNQGYVSNFNYFSWIEVWTSTLSGSLVRTKRLIWDRKEWYRPKSATHSAICVK
jgi:hypothetical protein